MAKVISPSKSFEKSVTGGLQIHRLSRVHLSSSHEGLALGQYAPAPEFFKIPTAALSSVHMNFILGNKTIYTL